MTDKKSLTWRDVFDSYKIVDFGIDIFEVNTLVRTHTKYLFFAFNGRIHKTMNPDHFSIEESNTGLTVEGL